MPRTGKTAAVRLLWTLLSACLICAGCATDRDIVIGDADSPMWQTVPPPLAAAQPAQEQPQTLPQSMVQAGAVRPELPSDPVWQVAGTFAMQEEVPVKPPIARTPVPPVQSKPLVVQGPPSTAPVQPLPPAGFPFPPGIPDPVGVPMPRELNKVAHPTYVIQPPDELLIDAARLVPLPPYRIEPMDTLAIYVPNTLPNQPIERLFPVDASGSVDLGYNYGSVMLAGQTLPEAKQTIEKQLEKRLKPPLEVYVSVAEMKQMQQIRGPHLVRQDGTIGLGTYGSVYVTGLTVAQAKAAVEKHLEQFLYKPRLSVDIAGFNSHVYYVIYDLPGTGQYVMRWPITGNETVLDAVSTLRSLPQGVSKRRIWVARPAPANSCKTQILPVDWEGITRRGQTATNYQLLPGDRVFLAPDPCSNLDAQLARLFSPIERVFGIALLGNSTILNFRTNGINGGGVR